jgi:hypothetical protein
VPTHFDIDRWADFVRGLANPAEHAEMERHLAQGCERCSQQVSLLQRLVKSAVGIRAAPEVSDAAMKRALAIFQPAPCAQPERHSLIASLIFDSFAAPAMAGVRGARSGTRRLSYRAENFELDLLADFDRRSQTVTITGQLSDRVNVGAVFARVLVQLVSGRRVLRQTAMDEFGEFQLDSPIGKSLALRVVDKVAALQIDVPLGPLWTSRPSQRQE